MPLSFETYVHGGPRPNYSPYHVWKCYSLIEANEPIGRRSLAAQMNLGEGSVRTLLERMSKEGCIELVKRGAQLTEKGREKFQRLGVKPVDVGLIGIELGKFNSSMLVKGMAHKIDSGLKQRNEAVRAGAEDAFVLVARNGKIFFPGDERSPLQAVLQPVKNVFRVEDGDAIVIAGADTYELAEKGAAIAALSLVDPMSICWDGAGPLLSRDFEEDDIKSIALLVHEIVGRLPVTMRSKNHYGVRCEEGRIIETNFTGPVLEETLKKGKVLRRMSKAGKYRGCPVLAVPLIRNNDVIAVVGVFDVTRGSYAEWLGKTKK